MALFVAPDWMVLALAGAVGQLLRVCVGVKKAVERGEKISPKRIASTLAFAAFSGAVVGYFYPDWRASFLSGYSVTDFAEGLVKAIAYKQAKPQEEEEEEK